MTDWIHCNKCFLRYQQKCKFYLTTCGHVKCEKCVSTLGPEKRCLVCNSACNVVQLSSNLEPDIQSFFRPYKEDLKGRQIYTFQYKNVTSLQKNISAKYNFAKGELRKRYMKIQDLKKQNAQLKMMASSKSRGGFAVSTPRAGVSISPMNASSIITPIRMPSALTLRQMNDSVKRFMPRKQPRCPAETIGPQTHIQVNSATLKPVPFFGELQRNTSSRSEVTPQNPAMTSLSRLQFGSNSSQKYKLTV